MATSLIRGLEVFCALIEAGSATGAAQQLGLSQPAVSQQIARLESELSLMLFVRENGRMRPTETALMIYEEAGHAFDGLDRVLNLAKDIRGLERGQLRVAAPYSSAATYLPRALRKLTSAQPRLRLMVHLGSYERIVGLVAAREVDLGIAKAPLLVPGVESVEICTSRLVAVTAADNPLIRRKSLSPKDLKLEPLIMIGRGRPWRNEIDVAFRRAGIAPRVSVETQSVESACGFAAERFGTAIVPQWLADAVPRTDITILPFKIGIEHQFLVVYPSRTEREDLARDFADACRDALSTDGEQSRRVLTD